MTLLTSMTLPGTYVAAIETARRADAEAAATAPAAQGQNTLFNLPLWSAWGARTA